MFWVLSTFEFDSVWLINFWTRILDKLIASDWLYWQLFYLKPKDSQLEMFGIVIVLCVYFEKSCMSSVKHVAWALLLCSFNGGLLVDTVSPVLFKPFLLKIRTLRSVRIQNMYLMHLGHCFGCYQPGTM